MLLQHMGLPDYASILIVAALIAALLFFSLTMLGWCTYRSIDVIQSIPPTTTTNSALDDKFQSFTTSLESHSKTFQFRAAEAVPGTDQTECIICLALFEEEESVRQLHSCRHIFHTTCIDMWLASHSGCPLCRTQIDLVPRSPNDIEEASLPRSVASEENGHNQMILFLVSSS